MKLWSAVVPVFIVPMHKYMVAMGHFLQKSDNFFNTIIFYYEKQIFYLVYQILSSTRIDEKSSKIPEMQDVLIYGDAEETKKGSSSIVTRGCSITDHIKWFEGRKD